VLSKTSWVAAVEPVETNILIFSLAPHCNDQALIEEIKKNISISSMGPGKLRIVTHLDYREVMHTYVLETLSKLEM
jgi:threonine aldolase